MSKLQQMKNGMGGIQKVLAWLKHIEEFDQKTIDEVVEQCNSDPEAFAYYVRRYMEDVEKQPKSHAANDHNYKTTIEVRI